MRRKDWKGLRVGRLGSLRHGCIAAGAAAPTHGPMSLLLQLLRAISATATEPVIRSGQICLW